MKSPDLGSPAHYRAQVAAGRRTRARPLRRLGVSIGVLILAGAVAGPFLLRSSPALPGGGTGLAIWAAASSSVPSDAAWDGSTFTGTAPMVDMGVRWRIIQGAASQDRDEAIVVGVTDSELVRTQIWDGSAWTEPSFSPLDGVNDSFWWSFDVAYESVSGDAVLVWNNGTTGTAGVSYRVLSGGTWGSEGTISAPVGGEPKQMQLAASPDSDEMVLVVSTGASHDYAVVWNGSSWGNSIDLSTVAWGDLTDVYVAYEQQSGDALVVYGEQSADVRYRTWSGSVWSGEFSVASPSPDEVRWVTLGADPTTNRIAMGVSTFGDRDIWLSMWDGATWGSTTLISEGSPVDNFPGVAVAFEPSTGEALATYAESTNTPRYRTWNGSWSAEQVGPDLKQDPNSMVLSTGNPGDGVMLAIQDSGKDVSFVLWNGSSWGALDEVTGDSGENKNQPFLFLWGPPPNAAPAFDQDLGDRTDPEGASISLGSPATDPEGDTLTWSATDLPDGLSIDPASGLISGTIAPTAAGGSPFAVEIRVEDPWGGSDTDMFSWAVIDVPFAPTVVKTSSAGGTVLPGERITYKIAVTNGDAQSHTLDVTDAAPAGTTFVPGSAWVTYPVSSTENVRDDFNVQSYSNSNGSLPWAGNWQELGENDGPTTGQVRVSFGDLNLFDTGYGIVRRVDLSAFTTANLSYRVGTNGLGDGTMLVEVSPDSAAWTTIDTVTAATGVFTHTLDLDAFAGAEAYVRYSIVGGSTIFQINVDYVDITGTTGSGSATDPGGPLPAIASGYTLGPGQSLEIIFEVDVDASPGVSSIDNTVSVTTDLVPGPTQASTSDAISNQPPVAGDDSGATIQDASVTIDVLGNDADPNADALLVDSVTQGANGSVADLDTAVSYVPDPGWTGVDSFTYTVGDGRGGFGTASVTVLVGDAYLLAGTGGANGGDDQLTIVSSSDANAATNEGDVGSGTGTSSAKGLDVQPGSGTLFAAVGGQLGVVSRSTGEWSAVGSFGVAGGALGVLSIDDVNALSFDPANGFLYAVQNRSGAEDLLLRADPATGAVVTDAFGEGVDYVVIQAVGARDEVSSVAMHPSSGILYAGQGDDGGGQNQRLVTIDPVTGATSTIGDTDPPILTGLGFDEAGNLWGTGYLRSSPASQHLYRISTFDASTLDSVPIDNGGDYQAVAFAAPGEPPSFNQDLGDRSDIEGALVSLSASATDPDGGALAYSAVGLPGGLTIDVGTGLISGVVDFSAASGSPYATVLTVTDGSGLSDTDTFTWTVTNTNLAPVFDQDLVGRTDVEGAPVSLPAPATDPDGDPITYSATGLPPGVSIDTASGLITGTISAGAAAGSPYAVDVRATDSGGLFASDTFAWSITDGSLLFQEGIGGYVGTEDTQLWQHEPSAAHDADYLTIDLSEDGSSSESQGLLQFGGIVGTGAGQIPPGSTINSASLQLYVIEPSPHTITFHPMMVAWDEAATWNSLGNGIQSDGFEATGVAEVVFVANGTTGQRTINGFENSVQAWVDGTWANNGWAIFSNGDDGWDFYSSEYAVAAQRPRLVVDFTPNAGPVFDQNLGDRSDPEGTVVSLSSAATDPEGHGVTYSATGLPFGLSIDPASGLISGTINLTAEAGSPYSVQVTATDAYSASSVDTFTWTVTNTNQAPTVTNPGDRTNSENQSPTFAVAGSDPDGDILAWSATGLPDGLSIDPGTGVISGTLSYVSAGIHPVTVRATDPGLLFDEVGFTWTVLNVNRGPSVDHPGQQTVAEGDVFSLVMTATEPDGEPFTWSATGMPPGLSIDPITGEISGTVAFGAADSSPYASFIRATDSGVPPASGAALVNWTVTDTNQPPIVTDPGSQVSDEGDLIVLPMTAIEPDGDGLTWSATGLPVGLSIDPGTGTISGVIDFTAAIGSPYSAVVTATDDGAPPKAGQVSFTWTVDDINRAPSVSDPGDQADAEGDSVSLPVVGSDPDGDTLTWSAAGLPPGLSIDPDTGEISGTLSFSSAGTYPVAVRATDDGVGSLFDEVAFTWSVAETNRPPVVANPGNQVSLEGDPVAVTVTASDPELDGITWSAVGLPPGLSIDPGTGEINGDVPYTAASGSPYAVSVTATDDGTPSEAGGAAFSWVITDINLAPTITDPGLQANRQGEVVSLNMVAVDPEGHGFTWAATGLPTGLAIDPISGEISGVVTAPATTFFTVTIEATDDGTPTAIGSADFRWVIADDLGVTKVSDAGGTAGMGQAISYTIAVDNPGPAAHTGVAVTDVLPAGTTWVSTLVTYPVDGAAGNVKDGWDSVNYSGSTGSIPWSGPWVETGDDGSPYGGSLKIHYHNGRWLVEVEDGAVALTRTVDLSGYSAATVSYEFRRLKLKDAGDTIVVEVSSDGTAWTEIARHTGPGDDWWQVKAPIDITDHLSATTMIRFRSLASHDDGELRVDWVEISATQRVPATVAGAAPPNLASGVTLLPGETMTVEMVARVDDPLDRAIISIDNTATLTSAQQVAPAQDSATDAVNHRPLFDQDRTDRTDAENAAVTLPNQATDPNGDVLTWSATGLPVGVSIDPSTGVLSGTIDFDASAGSPYAVTLRVEDPTGTFDLDTFTWTVTNTNRAPLVANPGDQSDAEADTISLAMTGSDPDGDGLTWSATGLPLGLTIDPSTGQISGVLTYDASPSSPYAVVVRATDDGVPNLFGEVGFLWAVANTNRPPVLIDPGAQNSAEGDPISLLIAGSDPDLDGITWSANGLPAGLAMNPVTGEISGTITYDASSSSPYVVSLRVTDDGAPTLFDEAVLSWTVTDTNRAPTAIAPANQNNAEGETVSLPVSASDPDLDTLTWTASSLPPGLLMDSATGIISGTLTYGASSTYTVTVRVTDDRVPFLFDEVSFMWDVADVNRNPVLVNPGDRSAAEGDAISLLVAGTDPDLDTLTWTASNLPSGLLMDSATGIISGTISYEASPLSPYSVVVEATDDGTPVLSATVAFSWTVADTNRAPVLVTPGDRASGETDVIALSIPASDPDLDTLTWATVGLPPGLSIDPRTGEITGTVSFDAASGSPFTVTVTVEDDGFPALKDEVTFSWLIANTNRAPVVTTPTDQSSDEGDAVALSMTGFDPDTDGVTWSASGLPTGLTISAATGTISGGIDYMAAADSPYVVMVTATDDGNPSLWTTTVFSWTVADVNRPPTLTDPGPQESAEGDAIVLPIAAIDPDNDVLTWAASGLPDGLAIDADTGVISGTIGFESAGIHQVTVSVTDDRLPNLSDEISVVWTVTDTNRAPVLTDPGDQVVGEEEFDSVTIVGVDPDGDDLSWTASGLPAGMSINASTGVVSGTLTNSGVFSVTVTATDDGVPSLAASVGFTWTVNAIEPIAPIIGLLDDRSDLVGDEVTIVPTASSPDGETLTWSATGLPEGVGFNAESGVMSGTLAASGVFEVEVTVSDPRGLSATAGFVWTVGEGLPVDEPPRAEDDVITMSEAALERGAVLIDVLANDSDPEGTALRITWLSDPDVGEASIVAGAAVSFHPPEGWLGTTRFSYVVADAAGNTDTASVVVTIQPDLDERAAGTTLLWTPPEESRPTSVVGTLSTPETTLVVGSIVQSLHVLRMPLTLLGGAVVWSLLLGGAFNLTLLLRGGVPFISRKARLHLAVVLARHGQRIPAHIDPGEGEVIHRFGATAKGVGGSGRIVTVDGVDWTQVDTPEGRGWVEAVHLTEEIDAETFAADPAPQAVLGEFVARLRKEHDLTPLVSQAGLWVSHHDDPVHYTPEEVAELTTSSDARVWKGRNPAFPDIRGTFQEVVAAGLVKVWELPDRLIEIDKPSVPSTIVPVEYTNFHALSIGASVTGRERLDQVAWMAHFAYEDGTPYLIALTKEG